MTQCGGRPIGCNVTPSYDHTTTANLQNKKPRVSNAAKKRRVVESDEESDDYEPALPPKVSG